MIVKGFAEHWQEQEQSVRSFRWTVENFPMRVRDLVDKNEGPLTSGEWTTPNGHKLRVIFTQDLKLFIQLVATPFPARVELRYEDSVCTDEQKKVDECCLKKKTKPPVLILVLDRFQI